MKKYKLVVKEEYMGKTLFFPKPIGRKQVTNETVNYLSYNNFDFEFIGNKPKEMTIEEINELTYGFLNMFNIVEVEDKKYRWRVKDEHLIQAIDSYEESYLNRCIENGELSINSKVETTSFETKFTEEEAKEFLGDDFDKFEKEEC